MQTNRSEMLTRSNLENKNHRRGSFRASGAEQIRPYPVNNPDSYAKRYGAFSMNWKVGRITPCAPVEIAANAARRGLTLPATAGSWSRFASSLWRLSLHLVLFLPLSSSGATGDPENLNLPGIPDVKPRNIIFVLCDDHRYDAMSFLGHPFLETPNMDRMARQGVYFQNAFVTTSLCSPSRASIMTGLYAHSHGVVDNYNPVDSSLIFFPQYLQKAGYETAFVGKWHMGGEYDDAQRGFDHWLSFKGQGTYWADGHGTTRVVPQTSSDGFNLNGKRVPQRGYITDELTDYAIEWLESRRSEKPFFLYLSHKAVHSDFVPADRHRGRYAGKGVPPLKTLANSVENYADKPMWLKNQRNSRHGVDFAYNLPNFDLDAYYQRYCESLLAVDDSLGRVLSWLERNRLLESTLVVYMGDNGFQFGEHGLIDKRTAYEASIRVPLLVQCPELFRGGTVVTQVVANIDIAPTLLASAGLQAAPHMQGRNFLPLAERKTVPWREALLYEYYWERNYPQTPTIHSVRTDRYKYIRYHGIWDVNELYDLQAEPEETRNLIHSPAHQKTVSDLSAALFQMLSATDGNSMPLLPDRGSTFPWRKRDGAKEAQFPDQYFQEQKAK